MDIFNKGKKSANKKYQSANHIETLKDSQSSSPFKKQAKAATFGVARGVSDQLFGNPGNTPPNPNQPLPQSNLPQPPRFDAKKSYPRFNFEDFMRSRERQVEYQSRLRYQRKIEKERLVFHRKEEDAKTQIKAIQEELKKLIKSTQGLTHEVKKAVLQEPVEIGTYHFNFFERIRRLVLLARKKVAESRTWMQEFNTRKKHRSIYWNRVKKSGTKFMLSHERYMVTQTG